MACCWLAAVKVYSWDGWLVGFVLIWVAATRFLFKNLGWIRFVVNFFTYLYLNYLLSAIWSDFLDWSKYDLIQIKFDQIVKSLSDRFGGQFESNPNIFILDQIGFGCPPLLWLLSFFFFCIKQEFTNGIPWNLRINLVVPSYFKIIIICLLIWVMSKVPLIAPVTQAAEYSAIFVLLIYEIFCSPSSLNFFSFGCITIIILSSR